jgi:hypothetical protein
MEIVVTLAVIQRLWITASVTMTIPLRPTIKATRLPYRRFPPRLTQFCQPSPGTKARWCRALVVPRA